MEWWLNLALGFLIGYFAGNKDFRQKLKAWLSKKQETKEKK